MIVTKRAGVLRAKTISGCVVESDMVVVPPSPSNFLEFDTISRLPIDPSLVAFEIPLPKTAHQWLVQCHHRIQCDVEPLPTQNPRHGCENWCERSRDHG